MPDQTPAVVDKSLIDIDFSHGINEADAPYSLDWKQWVKAAVNLDFGQGGLGKARLGLNGVLGGDANTAEALTPITRLLSTKNGVIAVSGIASKPMTISQMDESGGTASALFTNKGRLSEYSVTPLIINAFHSGFTSGIPAMSDVKFTTNYYVSAVADYTFADTGTTFLVFFTDRASGNTVRSLRIYTTDGQAGTLRLNVVGEYVHLVYGLSGSYTKLMQFDCTSLATLPTSVPSTITLTDASIGVTAGIVTSGSTSVIAHQNGRISRVSTTPAETATADLSASVGSISSFATDGTSFYLAGSSGGSTKVVKLNSSFVETAAVTNGASPTGGHLIAAASGTDLVFTVTDNPTVGTEGQPQTIWGVMSVDGGTYSRKGNLPLMYCSQPVYCSAQGAFYCVSYMLKDYPVPNIKNQSVQALIQLKGYYPVPESPLNGSVVNQLHIAAVLDAYVDSEPDNTSLAPWTPDGGLNMICHPGLQIVETNAAGASAQGVIGASLELRHLRLNDVTQTVIDTDTISGGKLSSYDGMCAAEYGFIQPPHITTQAVASAADIPGTYSYVANYEFIDALGQKHYSVMSPPRVLELLTTQSGKVYVSHPVLSDHKRYEIANATTKTNHITINVYRTTNGGTQYYKVASAQVTGASTITNINITDSITDAQLVASPIAYRQPGTDNTALDRYYALAASCTTRHKDRVFYGRGSVVYYSSFNVFGEAPWFNPNFQFSIPGGIGPVTAMSSMEGVLVIFKKNAIFLVDGDGPPENGGLGTEFSPPRRILSDVGCVDPRTLIYTNDGLMFRSERGLELLRRNYQVEFIGQAVQTTVDSYPYNGGATFDSASGRAIWVLGAAQHATIQGALSASGAGLAVVYDTTNKSWGTYSFTTGAGAGKAFQDVVSAEVGSSVHGIAGNTRLLWADPVRVYFEDGYKDKIGSTSYFIPWSLETGWIRADSKVDRLRVSDLYLSMIRNADATMTVSYARDYSPTYITIKAWTPADTGALTVVQLDAQVPKENCQSISFKVASSDPTPTSYGTGQQFDIFGISARVGLKGAGAKLPAAQKG